MQDILNWFSQNIAIIIGFLSILLAFLTFRLNKKHQRLSVIPIGDISTWNYENKLSVLLENNGIGPLIITSFRATINGVSKNNIIDLMPQLPKGIYWSNYFENFEGSAIKPSESIILLEFSLNMKNRKESEFRDLIRRTLSEIVVEFNYTDIYGNPKKYLKHSLSRFERNL